MKLAEVDTPALIVDLDAFEGNLRRLSEALPKDGRIKLRPHAKTHKSPDIALQQMQRGAVGVCCQKVSEADVLIRGGVGDILVSNQVVGRIKQKRLAALAEAAKIGVCVDDVTNVGYLDAAAAKAGVTLRILVEIDVGMHRCGIAPGEPAARLAEAVARSKHLRLGGLQAYHGAAQHTRDPQERRAAIQRAGEMAGSTRDLIRRNGIDCPIITGGGTGSFRFEIESGVWDELQCGSYVFMDADYARNPDTEKEFEHSLFVWATVMSRPSEDRAVVDAGHKAYSIDSGLPTLPDFPEAVLDRAADEHGRITLKRPTNQLRMGDKIRLIPGHCDPTVNLHDWYVGVRHDRVETLWPIAARGALT